MNISDDSLTEKYDVIKKIGEGSFSEVIKVKEFRTGNAYAAKRLTKIYSSEDDVANCIELKATRNLEYHPNVVSLVDVVYHKYSGNLTLIFELMDMSMYDFLKNRTRAISEIRVKNFLYQVVCGIKHLHSNGIFHRDIKPENILIKANSKLRNNPTKGEIVKISDLGSVCNTYLNQPHSAYISTRWYRAPECLLTSGYYGAKMDIWAIGCVFYEMLTLNPLFPGKNELDQLFKIHEVLGSPSEQMLSKFKHLNIKYLFPKRRSISMYELIPLLSDDGVDILNKILRYHPDERLSIFRTYEHSYFNDLKVFKKSIGNTSNPLLNFGSCSTTHRNSCDNSSVSIELADRRKLSSFRSLNQNVNWTKYGPSSTNQSFNKISKPSIMTNRKKLVDTNKQLERVWGMNTGKKKNEILYSLKRK